MSVIPTRHLAAKRVARGRLGNRLEETIVPLDTFLALLLFAVATLRRRVWFEAAPVRGQQGIGRTRTAANSGGQNDFQTNVPF